MGNSGETEKGVQNGHRNLLAFALDTHGRLLADCFGSVKKLNNVLIPTNLTCIKKYLKTTFP